MSGYQPPSWAGVPPILSKEDSSDEAACWQLLEIKSGIQVGQHNLSQRACTLLGRAEDQVHIPLPHESCSRLHARIAFDKSTGTPWLRDLGSSHGTTVNKKKLPAQACGRQESATGIEKGSRGVILYPGDILQFGASTRLFCLEGPASFGRGAQQAAALQKKALSSSETPNVAAVERPVNEDMPKHTDKDESYVSWGMDMDGTTRGVDGTNVDDALVREQIPQEHLKAFDTIQALRYKLTNLQKESNSIRRKGELTAGQERQLQRNEARETDLQQTIDEKEEELRRVLCKSSSFSSVAEQEKLKSLFNVEEDVDDRTKEAQQDALKLSSSEEAATEESLTAEWKNACTRQLSIMSELDLAEKQRNEHADNLRLLQAKEDEDAFFLENELQLARDKCSKLEQEKSRLEELFAETERLLKIVNPRLIVDRETGFIGTKLLPKAGAKPQSSCVMAPPPARIREQTEDEDIAPAVKESNDDTSNAFMPPPKRKRVMGPTAMPPPMSKESMPFVESRERAVGPVTDVASKSTLGVLLTGSSTRVVKEKKMVSSEEFTKPLKRANAYSTNNEITQLGGKVDIWQAPKDQDGSGRSKLNEKFAGRY